MQPLAPIPLPEIQAVSGRFASVLTRTPLLTLRADAAHEIRLKLENLQPIGSFKLRGAANAVALADPARVARGLATASAGNMARAVAWIARQRRVPCSVVVPEHAPAAKLEPVAELGAHVIRVPFAEWWQALVDRGHPDLDGVFIHPFADPAVIAGNGTIGLELLDEWPELEAVVVPFGGGGLACGIGCAVKALRPDIRVYAAEVATAAPFAASLAAGQPVEVDYAPSFVDGIGSATVLPEMWPLASGILDGSIVVGLQDVARSVRRLAAELHVVAEGAGAAALAAAIQRGETRTAAIVSGGNIEPATLATLLSGGSPPTGASS
jgi:threonine dehydratase